MGDGVKASFTGVGIIAGPPNVVVASSVGGPGCRRGFVGRPTQRCFHEADVASSQGAPQLHHEAVVIDHVADFSPVAPASEISREIVGANDGIGHESDGGRDDPYCLTQ